MKQFITIEIEKKDIVKYAQNRDRDLTMEQKIEMLISYTLTSMTEELPTQLKITNLPRKEQ